MSEITVTDAELAQAAQDLRNIEGRIHDAKNELAALYDARSERLAFIKRFAPVGSALSADDGWYRVVRGQARRSVNELRCDELREVLIDCGLGSLRSLYKSPTIREIEAAAPALLARGIDPARLIDGPGEPEVVVKFVPREEPAA